MVALMLLATASYVVVVLNFTPPGNRLLVHVSSRIINRLRWFVGQEEMPLEIEKD